MYNTHNIYTLTEKHNIQHIVLGIIGKQKNQLFVILPYLLCTPTCIDRNHPAIFTSSI
jgi:hypothetical protein